MSPLLMAPLLLPTIVWWPKHIPAGTQTSAITTTMDFLPTLANLCGATSPTDRTLDGIDISSVLTDDKATPLETFYYFRSLNLQAVRKRAVEAASGENGTLQPGI